MKLELRRRAKPQSQEGPKKNGRVSAAEMYQVQDSYVRFNQRDHMGSQMVWDTRVAAERDKLKVKQRQLTEKGRAGFEAPAWSLDSAADSLLSLMDFSKNQTDTKATAWQSKVEPSPTGRPETTPKEASQIVRKAAHLLGADQVGFAELDRRWVYSHYFDEETKTDHPIMFSDDPGYEEYDQPIRLEDGTRVIPKEMKYVVVVLHEWGKNLDGTEHAPSLLTEGLSTLAYARMAPTLWMLAEFIRGLGYQAIPAANDTALSIPLAVDAGLGQLGRHGLLINPKVGARCRISKIFTDLPLEAAGAVDSGITEFCNACLKCVPKCGTKAISTGNRSFEPLDESNSAGVLSWKVDAKKCMTFQNRVGTTCSTCVRRCAWTKPPRKAYAIPRFFIRNFRWRWLNKTWVWLDDRAGNGKFDKKADDFWVPSGR
jgi:epoxyqueuosine reductase